MTAIFTGAVHVTMFGLSILSSHFVKLSLSVQNTHTYTLLSRLALTLRLTVANLTIAFPQALSPLAGVEHVAKATANQSQDVWIKRSEQPMRDHLTTVVRNGARTWTIPHDHSL